MCLGIGKDRPGFHIWKVIEKELVGLKNLCSCGAVPELLPGYGGGASIRESNQAPSREELVEFQWLCALICSGVVPQYAHFASPTIERCRRHFCVFIF